MKNFRLIIIKIDKNIGFFNMTMDWTLSSVCGSSQIILQTTLIVLVYHFMFILSCKYKAINCLSEQNLRL